jgi:hypothetical protein
MSTRSYLVLALVLPALACASNSPPGEEGPRPSFNNVITREELRQLDARTAFEAIRQLRPRWLQVTGGPRSFNMDTQIVVFQDEALLGNTDVLERMGTEGIYSIRYVDGATAKASLPGLGDSHIEAAIIVSMRPPNKPDDGQRSSR